MPVILLQTEMTTEAKQWTRKVAVQESTVLVFQAFFQSPYQPSPLELPLLWLFQVPPFLPFLWQPSPLPAFPPLLLPPALPPPFSCGPRLWPLTFRVPPAGQLPSWRPSLPLLAPSGLPQLASPPWPASIVRPSPEWPSPRRPAPEPVAHSRPPLPPPVRQGALPPLSPASALPHPLPV